jgi:GT2 family glycosyltransferase
VKIIECFPEPIHTSDMRASDVLTDVEWEFQSVSINAEIDNNNINTLLDACDANVYVFSSSDACLSRGDRVEIAKWVQSETDFDIAYTNSRDARRQSRPIQRPAPSPERLRCQYFLGEVLIVSASFFRDIGGFRKGTEGAEVYDLVLRSSRVGAKIVHIAEPLYTATQFSSATTDWSLFGTVNLHAVRTVLTEHLSLTGGGQVLEVSADGVHDTRRDVIGSPLVSIVIPTRAQLETTGKSYLLQTLESILTLSTYPNFELVLVVDAGANDELMKRVRILCQQTTMLELTWDRPFNFSDKVNIGAVTSNGEYILLLNDDVQIISPDWIESMLALSQRENAGASGAMLYFEDDTIQHAGHAYRDGEASHVGLDEPRYNNGPLNGYRVEREIGGVTAACCLIPRPVFYEAGGFSGLLPGAFNDVDFCLKLTSLGYEIYWTPHAELYHFESKSRDASVRQFEVEVLRRRWGHKLLNDPYWPYPFSRPI